MPFSLGKSHIALAPMNGVRCFNVWVYSTDIDSIGDCANLKTHGPICVDLQYLMRSAERTLIFVLGTLAQHNLIMNVIGMRDARFIFVCIVLLNQTFFTIADIFSIRRVFYIKNHVFAKNELARLFL